MAGKRLMMVVVAGLAVVSFVAAFVLSSLFGAAPERSQAGQTVGAPAEAGTVGAARSGRVGSVVVTPPAEMLDELIKELRSRIDEYRDKDRQLEQREKRVRLAQESLKKQAKELEDLRMELVVPLTRLKEAKAELEQSRIRIAKAEEESLKRTATIYDKMDSESGSEILAQMCANKQEADAVKILQFMSERTAAKALAAMQDRSLAAKLSEMMKRVQQEK